MKAKEVADLTGTTVRAIRHYHHVGLLPVPDNKGVRRYELDHAVRIVRIRALADSGLSLKAIGDILNTENPDLESQLAAAESDIDRRIADLVEQRSRLREIRERHLEPEFHVKHSALLDDFYAQVMKRVPPEQVSLIERERRAAEVLCHIPGVRAVINRWLTGLTEERLEATLDLYSWFSTISELNHEDAERVIDEGISRYSDTMRDDWGLPPPVWRTTVPRVMAVPGMLTLLDSAYPHPNHRLFIRRFLQHVDAVIVPSVSRETDKGEDT